MSDWIMPLAIVLVISLATAPFILAFTNWAPAPNRQSYRKSDHPVPFETCSHPKGWTHTVYYTLTRSEDGTHFKCILIFCGHCHGAFFQNHDDVKRSSPESIRSAKAYADTQGFEYREE